MLTLSLVKSGQRVKVIKVKGDKREKDRLMRMGIVPGEEIEVIRVAPFGSPIEVLVKGYHLSLRKEEAECIEVKAE